MAYSRYAIYYMPRDGDLATFGAHWLGWDAARGCEVPQPDVPELEALTRTPRKYGFHGTLKPPFRLAPGTTPQTLSQAVAALAKTVAPATAPGLQLSRLGRFFALTPEGDDTGIARVAAACVTELDSFRAPLNADELAKRRKSPLSPRQEVLLEEWGYPYVLEMFRFHLTLTGQVPREALDEVEARIRAHLPALPTPFPLEDIVLSGERPDGRFELVERFALTG